MGKNRINGSVAARELIVLYAETATCHVSAAGVVVVMEHEVVGHRFPEQLPSLHHQIHVHDEPSL